MIVRLEYFCHNTQQNNVKGQFLEMMLKSRFRQETVHVSLGYELCLDNCIARLLGAEVPGTIITSKIVFSLEKQLFNLKSYVRLVGPCI